MFDIAVPEHSLAGDDQVQPGPEQPGAGMLVMKRALPAPPLEREPSGWQSGLRETNSRDSIMRIDG